MNKSKVEQFRNTPPRFSQGKLNDLSANLRKMPEDYPKPEKRNTDDFWQLVGTIVFTASIVSVSMWYILSQMVQG